MPGDKRDYLIPGGHKFTPEERSQGGKKSAEIRKKKRSLRDALQFINGMIPGVDEYNLVKSQLDDIDPEDIDRQTAVLVRLYKLAMSGDVKAMKLYLEYSDDEDGERRRLENEKLKAEVESMKGNKNGATAAPVFQFVFEDASLDDGDEQ